MLPVVSGQKQTLHDVSLIPDLPKVHNIPHLHPVFPAKVSQHEYTHLHSQSKYAVFPVPVPSFSHKVELAKTINSVPTSVHVPSEIQVSELIFSRRERIQGGGGFVHRHAAEYVSLLSVLFVGFYTIPAEAKWFHHPTPVSSL